MIDLVEGIRDSGKGITANRVRSTAHLIFNEGLYREFGGPRYLIGNPVAGTKPPLKVEPTRDRYLTPEGIGKLALLTGQRIGQVLRIRWDKIEDDVWETPPEHHKGARTIMTPLSPASDRVYCPTE